MSLLLFFVSIALAAKTLSADGDSHLFLFAPFVRLFKTTDIIYSTHRRRARIAVTMTQDKGFDVFSLSSTSNGHMQCAMHNGKSSGNTENGKKEEDENVNTFRYKKKCLTNVGRNELDFIFFSSV